MDVIILVNYYVWGIGFQVPILDKFIDDFLSLSWSTNKFTFLIWHYLPWKNSFYICLDSYRMLLLANNYVKLFVFNIENFLWIVKYYLFVIKVDRCRSPSQNNRQHRQWHPGASPWKFTAFQAGSFSLPSTFISSFSWTAWMIRFSFWTIKIRFFASEPLWEFNAREFVIDTKMIAVKHNNCVIVLKSFLCFIQLPWSDWRID